jgi:hypothetical protein
LLFGCVSRVYMKSTEGQYPQASAAAWRRTAAREVGRRGTGPVVGAVARGRTQGTGSPKERGKRPALVLGRMRVMTTILAS